MLRVAWCCLTSIKSHSFQVLLLLARVSRIPMCTCSPRQICRLCEDLLASCHSFPSSTSRHCPASTSGPLQTLPSRRIRATTLERQNQILKLPPPTSSLLIGEVGRRKSFYGEDSRRRRSMTRMAAVTFSKATRVRFVGPSALCRLNCCVRRHASLGVCPTFWRASSFIHPKLLFSLNLLIAATPYSNVGLLMGSY